MGLPGFCYEKAFKVILSIAVMTILGVTGIAWAQILENEQRSIDNSLELEKRYIPIYELLPQIYTNMDEVQDDVESNRQNILIICHELGVTCR